MKIDDETQQKAEWRGRLMADVLSNMHDEDTRAELLEAGLHQAHSEGVEDAAVICDRIAHHAESREARKVAYIIAKALRDYDARNKATRGDAGPSVAKEE